MDTTQILMIVGGTVGSAKVFEKLLGPTADYLGENLAAFAKKRVENVRNIMLNAQKSSEIKSTPLVPFHLGFWRVFLWMLHIVTTTWHTSTLVVFSRHLEPKSQEMTVEQPSSI